MAVIGSGTTFELALRNAAPFTPPPVQARWLAALDAYRKSGVRVLPASPTLFVVTQRQARGLWARLLSLVSGFRPSSPTTAQMFWPWIARHRRRHLKTLGRDIEYVPEAEE